MLAYAQDKAAELLQGGGVLTDKGLQRVWDLNTDFVAKNMSPGGSADLLIITIFMWKLEQLK
jgi:holo-ACP synthase/triphosphoribosyl-dephospho-CoA synthase